MRKKLAPRLLQAHTLLFCWTGPLIIRGQHGIHVTGRHLPLRPPQTAAKLIHNITNKDASSKDSP
jgi:hypothetical protein